MTDGIQPTGVTRLTWAHLPEAYRQRTPATTAEPDPEAPHPMTSHAAAMMERLGVRHVPIEIAVEGGTAQLLGQPARWQGERVDWILYRRDDVPYRVTTASLMNGGPPDIQRLEY